MTKPPLVSKIHDVRLLNPLTGSDLTDTLQTEKLDEPMTLQINIENSTKRTGYEFKVYKEQYLIKRTLVALSILSAL